MPLLILASSSPRRRALLASAGYEFEVVPPLDTAECGICSRETPPELVARLAWQKAVDVARRTGGEFVLGADTVAACTGRVLGKPRDIGDARAMLRLLSGREHFVYTGVCVLHPSSGRKVLEVDATRLRMDVQTDAALEAYLATGAWEGKAGAFGYQDGLDWVHVEAGSESNVVGLPLERLRGMLDRLGFPRLPAASA